jgi:hypothetical protein
MAETEQNAAPDENAGDSSDETPLRRRENRPVEFERRRNRANTFDIGALLEMHLDQCKTRRSMIHLLEEWLAESTGREQANQDPEYTEAVQRAIDVMKGAPDVETGIVMLQQRRRSGGCDY